MAKLRVESPVTRGKKVLEFLPLGSRHSTLLSTASIITSKIVIFVRVYHSYSTRATDTSDTTGTGVLFAAPRG